MNELVQRAGNGDALAQEELFKKLSPRIDKIVQKYAWIDGIEEDDLRQEAYVAVMECLSRVDVRIGSSSEYLLKFARWRLLDCLKKLLRQKRELPREDPKPEDSHPEPAAQMELLDARLNGIQKQILSYLMEGYTWREIGSKMGFTAANVSYYLKQIRKVYG